MSVLPRRLRHGEEATLVEHLGELRARPIIALVWAVAAWQGLEPPWWPRMRHSLAELGWRASGAWADFTDWVRMGR